MALLGRHSAHEEVFSGLMRALEDVSPVVRIQAIDSLQRVATPPILLTDRAQHDDSDQVRTTATEGLARLRWLATEIA